MKRLLLLIMSLLVLNCSNKNSELSTKMNLKENDKCIIVSEAKFDLVKKAVISFIELYQKPVERRPIIKLTKIEEETSLLTFPYDIHDDRFIVLVNYLQYPFDIKYEPEIKGWLTFTNNDSWIPIDSKIYKKRCMIFINPEDDEYDNVFGISKDNIPFKIGFAVSEGYIEQTDIIYKFVDQNYELDNLIAKSMNSEIYK